VRYYFNRIGKNIPLPGLPWSPIFMAAYETALNNRTVINTSKIRKPGSVDAAVLAYLQSDGFANGLAKATRDTRRRILSNFAKDHGDKPIALMHSAALNNIIAKLTPANQRGFKKAMRGFINFALSHNWIKLDPLHQIKLTKMQSNGFHTWTEDQIAQYQTRHPSGTKARLALQLLLQTGAARCDMVRMGRQHVKNGTLSMRRLKTNVPFDIPLLPELVAELEIHPKDQLTFLTTEYGQSFTAAGFGNWFRDRCDEAGLKDCAAHGLRKAAAVRHALNGATAPELMAWFGWTTLAEAQRYCEMASRITLAESAAAKMNANRP
jgi:site-specific recombinase XerD